MCAAHWRMVPKLMQDAIWAAYRPGQERRMDPSMEYLDAAITAQNYVRNVESLDTKSN